MPRETSPQLKPMSMTTERQDALEQLKVLQVVITRLEVEMNEAMESGPEYHILWHRLDALRVRRSFLENAFLPGSPPHY